MSDWLAASSFAPPHMVEEFAKDPEVVTTYLRGRLTDLADEKWGEGNWESREFTTAPSDVMGDGGRRGRALFRGRPPTDATEETS